MNPSTPSRLLAWFVLSTGVLSSGLAAQPGYKGSLPSATGRRALDGLVGAREGVPLLFGGGVFEIGPMVVTLHPMGPGRADVLELTSVRTSGPHVLLKRGKLGLFLPTRCDGDVRELHGLLGLVAPAGLKGEPSAPFERAVRAVRGLGLAVEGVRVGLARAGDGADEGGRAFELTVWNTGDDPVEWIGAAFVHSDGRRIPFGFHSPRLRPPEGGFRFRLGAASVMTVPLRVPAVPPGDGELGAKGGKEGDRPRFPAGDLRVVAELQVIGGHREGRVATTAVLPAPVIR